MPANGVRKVGVPFGIVAPYALLCGLQKSWHVATVKLITPPTVLRLYKEAFVAEPSCEGSQFFGPLPGLLVVRAACAEPKPPGRAKQLGPAANLTSEVVGAAIDRFNVGLPFTDRWPTRPAHTSSALPTA